MIRQACRKGMGPFPPDAAADIAGATAFGRASVIRISRSVSRRCASGGLCARLYARAAIRGRLAPPREGAPARQRTRRSRWRPCLGPRVRTARAGSPLAGRGCHHTRARVGVEALKSRHQRRCVLERRDAHREERRRHSALEPIPKQLPAAQHLLRKLAEALIVTPWDGR